MYYTLLQDVINKKFTGTQENVHSKWGVEWRPVCSVVYPLAHLMGQA
jgi:hypothetical protein